MRVISLSRLFLAVTLDKGVDLKGTKQGAELAPPSLKRLWGDEEEIVEERETEQRRGVGVLDAGGRKRESVLSRTE